MPTAIIYTIVILGALLIVGARVAARRGHLTSRASKLVMVAVIAIGGIIVMLYPFLFTEPVGG
ncbi:MAG: hypothetical protein M3Q08_14185 [Pseudomonadota bacterium]|jgi:uncharacterized membrane protein YhaH (DUF805 family)|nr:hypothetical protein [Pseudomonadota bacterium]